MKQVIDQYTIRQPSPQEPLRLLSSACLMGTLCGYDGSSYGSHSHLAELLKHPKVTLYTFCPEDYSFGTPRLLCDIHGGNGFDVLQGKARVIAENGEDWTKKMIEAAEKMLKLSLDKQIELALLMDISAACGSQVIYKGNRKDKNAVYQKGPGVCAALLLKNNIPVIAQRDFASIEKIYNLLNPDYTIDSTKIDHHQTEWYQSYFD